MNIIKDLPFFFKSNSEKNNGGFSQSLPFHLYYDNDLKMFRQKTNRELTLILDEIYKKGSLVEGSVSSESGKVYLEEFINYLFDHFDFNVNTRVLEVGFGSGIILKQLKERDIKNLTGIEPGNHKPVNSLEGIKLIKDFFPSQQFNEKVDLIFSFGILEHIEDPITFIRSQIAQISEKGKIIFAVPNCEPYIKEGDLSIFIHEHYSYFTTQSIINLVNKTGFFIEDISVIEGSFAVTICKNKISSLSEYEIIPENEIMEKIEAFTIRLNHFLSKYSQKEIAIYAPVRAMNALFIIGKTNVRLVDDNIELHGRYLPTLSSPIESYTQLTLNPPKCLLIFSRTFGERLKQKCKSDRRLDNTLILTLNDLDNSRVNI
jgi:2-polyprenyl-3-methyl-5-hydroxy-6-metoxy-1,4-benzoquinol methylase